MLNVVIMTMEISINSCIYSFIHILILNSICKVQSICRTTSHKEISFPHNVEDISIEPPSRLTVTLTWRHQIHHMVLERHDIVSSDAISEWRENDTVTEIELLQDDEIFYQGFVRGKRFSYAALSLSSDYKLTGYVQIDNEGVYIKPLATNHTETRTKFGPHLLQSCGNMAVPKQPDSPHTFTHKHRFRRAPGQFTKYLEVLVVADYSVTSFVGRNKVKSYLLSLMNIVNTVYHHDSLGANIEVVTVKLMYMDETAEKTVVDARNPQKTVDQFCLWASTRSRRTRRYAYGVNHDAAVLLTRNKFAPAGYAPITGMCVPMRNCALVKDDGFTSGFVIAHELAHIFGLMHDGHGNNCHGREYQTSIMASIVQSSFHHYWWSGCSKTRMAEVIGHLNCLNNNPSKVEKEDFPLPIGRSWSLDTQCRFEFGGISKHCRIFRDQDPCSQMWCNDGSNKYQCKTKNVVPLDGTQCGESDNWYCKGGSCGYHGNEKPINGAWNSWSSWSECSVDCGIGFKRRSRLCDDPKPQFNGKECDGERENSDTCKAPKCLDYKDVRAEQCSIMNIVPVRGTTHIWKPYQAMREKDTCKLTCISQKMNEVVTFDSLVDTGTPCSYDEPYSICIDGVCQKLGCDGVQGSYKRDDICGVCGGDGSTCKTITGLFNKKFRYSAAPRIFEGYSIKNGSRPMTRNKLSLLNTGGHYETILVLPKDSRDINIKETTTSPHFLSLQESYWMGIVLNPNGTQEKSRNFVLEGAWMKYTNNGGHEILKSKGPLHRDVNLLIYPTDWTRPASVRYSYTVSKDDFTYEKNKYQWRFENWSPCSVTCGTGLQHIDYGCYDKENDKKVDSEKCNYIEEQSKQEIECKRVSCDSIIYIWAMLREYSGCSVTCGQGVQTQQYKCERLTDDTEVDTKFCQSIPPPIIQRACNRRSCTQKEYAWHVTSKWSECSETCGNSGHQFQEFYCAEDGDDEEVDEMFCSDLDSPKELRPCNRLPCVEYKWELSDDWNDCNEKCGENGVQSRKVICQKIIGGDIVSKVGLWYCSEKDKDSETRPCNRRKCFHYKWEVTSDGECSATCGDRGFGINSGVCKNITYDNREIRVSNRFCNVTIAIEPCIRQPCALFDWKPLSNWSKCSETCGEQGIQTQIYKCKNVNDLTEKLNETNCKHISKPTRSRICKLEACLLYSYSWDFVGEWHPECQQTCLEEFVPEQITDVVCVGRATNGQVEHVDISNCAIEKRPLDYRQCKSLNCTYYRWQVTNNWAPCSVTCGASGIQSQETVCIGFKDNGKSQPTSNEMCEFKGKPPLKTRNCEDLKPCLRYINSTDTQWSECSATCGVGVQTLLQDCVFGDDLVVPNTNCTEANVSMTQRPCDVGPCGFLEWGAGPWSMCSRTCGSGQQKRQIYCGPLGTTNDNSRCPGKAPDEYRPCQDEPCGLNKARTCTGDKASFCNRASTRLCSHPAYNRVCCSTCQKMQNDQPSSWKSRRRLNRQMSPWQRRNLRQRLRYRG